MLYTGAALTGLIGGLMSVRIGATHLLGEVKKLFPDAYQEEETGRVVIGFVYYGAQTNDEQIENDLAYLCSLVDPLISLFSNIRLGRGDGNGNGECPEFPVYVWAA
jgi:hypothetical protein